MQLKTKNSKFINKTFVAFIVTTLFSASIFAQVDSTEVQTMVAPDSISQRYKVDGIAAVVGEYVVLDSDIAKMYIDLQSQGISTADVTKCELAGRMLENKLYAHHAIQDSIIVSDIEVNSRIEQQIEYMTGELGGIEKVLEFYKKDSEEEFRQELFDIIKENQLASQMQRSIIEDVEITPEEVRKYFNSIPEDERPRFGDEVEIAQIVIEPEVSEESKREAIKKLQEFRKDIVENGASFATKAVLYSDDQATRPSGGKITLSRQDPFVKEFKDAAFSLQEGEVSQPFETEFGYHLLTVDKIRGQKVDVRHILLIPEVSSETVEAAEEKIKLIRKRISDGELTFANAALEFSDEKETRMNGGQLINPTTGDSRFELTKVDPIIYNQVVNLNEGEISTVIRDQNRTGTPFFKIIMVTDKHAEHIANYVEDYSKIKELALTQKQIDEIQKWQKEKIDETYIKINGEYRDCEYASNWLKK
ncbi:MAG TPA: peptidylprolyl isomerase [Salinimicrobium sp.]|nr:peptidylprolyl isomerase [Salinimicrobium sp.]